MTVKLQRRRSRGRIHFLRCSSMLSAAEMPAPATIAECWLRRDYANDPTVRLRELAEFAK